MKKQEKEFLKEEENNQKKKHEKYRDYTIKHNNNINELRKEIYGEDYMNNKNIALPKSRGANSQSGNSVNMDRKENVYENNIEDANSVSNKEAKAYSVKEGNLKYL